MRRRRCRGSYLLSRAACSSRSTYPLHVSAAVAHSSESFSPTKVTFVIWWILGVAAKWVDEET